MVCHVRVIFFPRSIFQKVPSFETAVQQLRTVSRDTSSMQQRVVDGTESKQPIKLSCVTQDTVRAAQVILLIDKWNVSLYQDVFY